MTYFNNLNHKYNRVIFEFTDEEKQATGFLKTSKEPAILEMLRLLHRIASNTEIESTIVYMFHKSGDKDKPSLSRTEAVRKELHDCIDAGNYKIVTDIIKQVQGDNENILKDMENKKVETPFNKINLTNVSGLTDSITTVKKLGSVRDLVENKKYRDHVNLLDELQRKKDAWKGKAP